MHRPLPTLAFALLAAACAEPGAPSAAAPSLAAASDAPLVSPPAVEVTRAPTPTERGPAAVSAPPTLTRRSRPAMGSYFEITVAQAEPAAAAAAIDAALDEVDRVEALISEWRPDSDVGRLNAAAGGAPVPLSAETFEVLARSAEFSRATGGAFDVTWAALRGLWDFKSPTPSLPEPGRLRAALAHIGWKRLALDATARTARLSERGMLVGTGGIGQGYGVDRAVAVLRARGMRHFIVDGSGDLYLAGEKAPGVPWSIGVRHPREEGRLVAELAATDVALSSSGDYERFFLLGGKRYHHIIDLATGQPADKSVAVTVRAPDATTADALDTALFVLGPERGLEVARQFPGVDAAIFTPDGRIVATPGLAKVLPARWDAPPGP